MTVLSKCRTLFFFSQNLFDLNEASYDFNPASLSGVTGKENNLGLRKRNCMFNKIVDGSARQIVAVAMPTSLR